MKTENLLRLKKIVVRCLYIVGSLVAYRLALRSVETISPTFEAGHPTLKFASLMLLAAWIIWVNVRKLSPSVKRFVFGGFFLGLALLVGAWKTGCITNSVGYPIHDYYFDQLVYWGGLGVLLASLLPIVCKQKSTHRTILSNICFWTAILLLDFVVAMPNIWEDEQIYKCLYHNYAKKIYFVKTPRVCTILYGQDSLKSRCDENTRFYSVDYYLTNCSDHLWISDGGDSIYLTQGLNYYEITRPSGESFNVCNGSTRDVEWYATNCWQYNAWWKLKSVFNNQKDN